MNAGPSARQLCSQGGLTTDTTAKTIRNEYLNAVAQNIAILREHSANIEAVLSLLPDIKVTLAAAELQLHGPPTCIEADGSDEDVMCALFDAIRCARSALEDIERCSRST